MPSHVHRYIHPASVICPSRWHPSRGVSPTGATIKAIYDLRESPRRSPRENSLNRTIKKNSVALELKNTCSAHCRKTENEYRKQALSKCVLACLHYLVGPMLYSVKCQPDNLLERGATLGKYIWTDAEERTFDEVCHFLR